MIIAIDGPAGSGKGAIAKMIDERLNFTRIDTGAMYRCIALKMLRNGIGLNDINEIKKICASKKFNVYILTHVNSTNEMIAKIKYLHKNLPQVTVVSVPKEIPKTEVVNPSAAILIDDYSGNIKEWQKKLGIGIKFVKELEGSDYPEITHLSEVIDMFNQ